MYYMVESEFELKPGAVAHTSNSSYLGCEDWEVGGSKLVWAKN
jgi:hypothetical protein